MRTSCGVAVNMSHSAAGGTQPVLSASSSLGASDESDAAASTSTRSDRRCMGLSCSSDHCGVAGDDAQLIDAPPRLGFELSSPSP
jgi:hypothetical protein